MGEPLRMNNLIAQHGEKGGFDMCTTREVHNPLDLFGWLDGQDWPLSLHLKGIMKRRKWTCQQCGRENGKDVDFCPNYKKYVCPKCRHGHDDPFVSCDCCDYQI